MSNLSEFQWFAVLVSAVMIGLTKTSIPGLIILVSPLMAEVFPARASTGIVLPMLMFADVFAVGFYRRHAVWHHLLRIMPWTVAGVILGYLIMGRINDQQLKPFIGVLVLIMLGMKQWWDRKRIRVSIPTQWWFAAGIGVIAGLTTMMANVAGPFVTIYLLAMRLSKTEFIGTTAWYFLVLNWFKVPFSINLGLITVETLKFDLTLFPAIVAGILIGIKLIRHIPEKMFSNITQALAAAAAITLFI